REGFCFDNELKRHKVYLAAYNIASNLVTNGEYLEFINAGGYKNFCYWHSEGWDWVKTKKVQSPLYWHFINNEGQYYTLKGLLPIDQQQPVTHINYYEATAFAAWKGTRLPTEAEWEIAAPHFTWGHRWEWTESAYLPYPGFSKAEGAIGEYNGKFMVNQMVLRGASVATSEDHSRITYRNFFHPYLQWQFTSIRIVK
ncbi:MAG: SUMF1/EgtB/PvdO family nonheme iron enzyme, partial [Chitinophagaceae bacterium]|nr:SUMF1/EgtB/PvdO family nonheme iron enzyme [Chitinophagaceae bacterium]